MSATFSRTCAKHILFQTQLLSMQPSILFPFRGGSFLAMHFITRLKGPIACLEGCFSCPSGPSSADRAVALFVNNCNQAGHRTRIFNSESAIGKQANGKDPILNPATIINKFLPLQQVIEELTSNTTKARIGDRSMVPPKGGMIPRNRFK
jgi:hypothetical protein